MARIAYGLAVRARLLMLTTLSLLTARAQSDSKSPRVGCGRFDTSESAGPASSPARTCSRHARGRSSQLRL